MKLNIEQVDKPYIDADYYINVFTPNPNARITGTFNNVEEHKIAFDAYRQRASELVDRIVNNQITEAGGIDFVSPVPQMFLKKATAAIVQWWFITGYNQSELDNSISVGSLNITQRKNIKYLRTLIGADALLLIQKSGMWKGNVFGIELEQELKTAGIEPSDILLTHEALEIFQQKGQYDDNFHVDIDFSAELSGQDTDRWIKIAETERNKVSFNITGGSPDENARALLFINKDDFSESKSEAYIFSIEPLPQEQKPNFWAENNNGILSIYVEVKDNLKPEEAHFLISDIYADDKGEYKLFGSRTDMTGLTQIDKENVFQNADLSLLEDKIDKIEEDLEAIGDLPTQVATNTTKIADLENKELTQDTKITNLENAITNIVPTVNANTTNISVNSTNLQMLTDEVLKKDGSVALDSTFEPTNPNDVAKVATVEKAVTTLENELRTDFSALSGYETNWQGSEAFVRIATTNTGAVDTSVLPPASNGVFDYTNGKQINLTIELDTSEETITTRIGNDGKWDDAKQIFIVNGNNAKLEVLQIKFETNGVVTFRVIDEKGAEVTWDDIDNTPTLVALHQINGNIYSAPDIDIDDTQIVELEQEN